MKTYDNDKQFMWGESLMIAPVLDQVRYIAIICFSLMCCVADSTMDKTIEPLFGLIYLV